MNKKTILYCALAFALASCGGKKASGDEVAVEEAAPHSELNLSAELVSHLDSIAGIISSTAPNVDFKALVENGKFSLTDQQKKVKPDYLLSKGDIDDLATLQEKYVASAYLAVDMTVAGLYGLDDDDFYSNTMQRLAAETDEANQKAAEAAKTAPLSVANAQQFYQDMKKRNRLDKFYAAEAAYAVEMLYILSRDPDIYMPVMTDVAAMDLCKHVNMAYDGLVSLSGEYPDLKKLVDALKPIADIKASGSDELRHHLKKKNEEFAKVRAALLK
jgi:hypothetical protein